MRFLLVTILAIAIGGGTAYAWLYYGGFAGEKEQAIAFIDVYGAYSEVVREVETLVHAPGTEGNNSRAELETLLTKILTEEMDAEHRYTLTELAKTHLDTLKGEVDRAQSAQAELYERLQELDNSARTFSGMQVREKADAVVQLARKRAELTARITSVLSETHDQTSAIIARILREQGELTQAHIQYINDITAKAEERHATLSELYTELSVGQRTQSETFQSFVNTAL